MNGRPEYSRTEYVRPDGLLVYRGQDGNEYHAKGAAEGTMPGSRAEFARLNPQTRVTRPTEAEFNDQLRNEDIEDQFPEA